MPRSNADGWNERLIEAMRKRSAKDQAEGKQSWFMWHAAMQKLQAVQKNSIIAQELYYII